MTDRSGPAGASEPAAHDAAGVMGLLTVQRLLFAERPKRLDLLRFGASWPLRGIRIRVHRNQPFEFVASVLRPFLAFGGFQAEFDFGPYDDALGSAGEPPVPPADVELVWLDFGRYLGNQGPEAVAVWLSGRIRAIRLVSSAPILVADSAAGDTESRRLNELLRAGLSGMAGVVVVDQAAVADHLGRAYVDARSAGFAGSELSDAAAIETARRFGLAWIPAVLAPRLKAIVLDLDNTLYDGVLGEEGPADLVLSDIRAALQRRVVQLADTGLLLAVLTRNEPEDVARLFAQRPDFPLRPERLSALEASWRPKSEGMAAIAEKLRIDPDSILFVDDNSAELAVVGAAFPGISLLHAENCDQALLGLLWYPGLAGIGPTREDNLRAADLATNETRGVLEAAAADTSAYLRSLQIRLTFALSPTGRINRMHELSVKTNQFNTGFLRLSETDAAALLADPTRKVVTVSLRDRLSDSGVIGLIVSRMTSAGVIIEEVAISCRALGRSVEDAIIVEALRGSLGTPPPNSVRFVFRAGPRNGPARGWLERISGAPVEPPEVQVPWTYLEEARQATMGLVDIVWSEE